MQRIVHYYRHLDHNVRMAYIYTLFFWSCRSILIDQVLAGYVYVLTNSNEPVGWVTGINGIVRLMVAIPGGMASDYFRRDTVLKAAGVLGLLCVGLSFTAYLMNHMTLLYVAYGCWGAYFAIQRPALEAIFADSVPQGERGLPFTIKYNLMNLSGVLGPLACIIFFQLYGDEWTLSGLQLVLCGGLVIGIPGILALFCFNDDLAIDGKHTTKSTRGLSCVEDNGDLVTVDDVAVPGDNAEHVSLLASTTVDVSRVNTFLCFGPRHVPLILFCTDFIMYNGSGLSIIFLPLFLQNEYGLTPSHINLLVLVQQLLVVTTTSLAQFVGRRIGDIETVVLTRVLAAFVLLAFTYGTPLWFEITMFLVRTSIMRSSQPLRSAILMDHVPKAWRGRWNALESLTMFCFCGTSIVGGYLIEQYGYRVCFFVTSLVWFVGLMLEMLLVPIIRNERVLLATPSSRVQP
ncbi:Aste57867_1406 [Aphanomyces stellatus]|uniref:Aste57867_1406 protein n=1 Tax=Aphanomyces stellatus TaxID=120398 RepID=A0A485K6D7_9STRA|nr:hypothetical protein As57867_001405 [Aphanomyces stellatus]VFT78623.1 Aste57867_1406 [Aphanomyces stellatus]